jgi:hypothetical protein
MQVKKLIVPRFRSHFRSIRSVSVLECMAGTTGLEPATSAVTGQRSNQLSYVPRRNYNNRNDFSECIRNQARIVSTVDGFPRDSKPESQFYLPKIMASIAQISQRCHLNRLLSSRATKAEQTP